ncbi:MAG: HAMP domain-containing protein [Bacteroidetes bacterium]|nr:HAMP domain-containing protein [Bacteroidota bacterium]
MKDKIIENLKGEKKYLYSVFLFVLLFFLSGFITPIILKNITSNWNKSVSKKITEIENSVRNIYKQKEQNLFYVGKQIKNDLIETLSPRNRTYAKLIKLINNPYYDNYSIEILAPNGKLIAWTKNIAIPVYNILPLSYPAGHLYFYDSDLITYLSVTDTIIIENEQFYFSVSLPIEKKYKLNTPYYIPLSFTEELTSKFDVNFKIFYSPFAENENNKRTYSFELLNNNDEKIALITFDIPLLENQLSNISSYSSLIQSLLLIIAFLLLLPSFRIEYKRIKHKSIKIVLLIIYLFLFRLLLFNAKDLFDFLIPVLTNPSYYSSKFAYGFVKSPIDFFISVLFVLIISIKIFQFCKSFLVQNNKSNPLANKWKYLHFVSLPFLLILFLFLIRGLNASVKSVIFDSTLRYFKEPNLIPDLPSLLMNLNVLLLGISIILILIVILLFFLSIYITSSDRKFYFFSLVLFVIFQICAYYFIELQPQPLITQFLSFVIIILLFLISIRIYYINPLSIYNYFYIAVTASIIVVSLMNYFNLDLEKESLKTTALEVNRSNDNLFEYFVNELLIDASNDGAVKSSFMIQNTNYNALAFKIWSGSSLQKESLPSSVVIFDRNKIPVGNFNLGLGSDAVLDKYYLNEDVLTPEIFEIIDNDLPHTSIITGYMPVKLNNITVGFISASVKFNLENLGLQTIPDFLASNLNIVNSVININQLKIFTFENSKVTQIFSDIYPSLDQVKPILNANFSKYNEAWIYLTLNNEQYLTYVLKSQINDEDKIISVSVLEKDLSWDLYNFFKLFIVQSIFMLVFLIFLFISNIKKTTFTFRTQLLIAFLIISIMPVVLLAVYNRSIIEKKSITAISQGLNERSKYVEDHIRSQIAKHEERTFPIIFNNTAKELGISFSVYKGTDQLFSSKQQFYDTNIFSTKIDPIAHYYINYLNYKRFIDEDHLDRFTYQTIYKKINLKKESYIISVNNAFNKIIIPYSVIEVDVFLFGMYSFAVILIIIFSTIISNRISSPVRKLTGAAKSIGQGDFDISLDVKVRGEMKELVEGFNAMAREIQKNQIEMAELERENAWKEMAKQVAHEVKNPLTPMKLAVQQLLIAYEDKKKNFSDILKKLSETILSQIDNLNLIATEFSNFGRMPLSKIERINIVEEIRKSCNLFLHEKIKIDIKTEIDAAEINADSNQLRRMLINFIRNSIQAESTKIMVSISKSRQDYIILIEDNGKGIPQKDRDKVYNSNFTTKEKGMGLGLYLAKRYIESLEGNISLLKSSKNGTTFKILIPLDKKE